MSSKQFYKDLEKSKQAEQIVKETIRSLSDYEVEDVSNQREYFHKGDLKVNVDGKEIFVEVKDDSRIADTGNILCEDWYLFFDNGEQKEGNFHYDYEVYAIVSKQQEIIYFLDFHKLQQYYKHFPNLILKYPEQMSKVYLLPLRYAKKQGALIKEVCYAGVPVKESVKQTARSLIA